MSSGCLCAVGGCHWWVMGGEVIFGMWVWVGAVYDGYSFKSPPTFQGLDFGHLEWYPKNAETHQVCTQRTERERPLKMKETMQQLSQASTP
jgi:hypothetical protein